MLWIVLKMSFIVMMMESDVTDNKVLVSVQYDNCDMMNKDILIIELLKEFYKTLTLKIWRTMLHAYRIL